jgi:hypothetical protein
VTEIKTSKEHDFPLFWKIILGGFCILLLAFSILFIYKFYVTFDGVIFPSTKARADWGTFGDYFGGVLNPIFGFSSFLALLVTIIYQAKELKLSRTELELSRVELSNSAIALTNQNKAIELQSFEQTFFSWLNTYHSFLDSIEFVISANNVPHVNKGRTALNNYFNRQFHSIQERISSGNVIDSEIASQSKGSWENTYKENEYQLDSLFRTLYRLILWVDMQDKLNDDDKWLYISIIRSQLSWVEMVYLFYNCLTDRGYKFKALVEKYAIFDNLVFNNNKSLTKLSCEYLHDAFDSSSARRKLGLSESQ